ncbi:hypothetical protein TeGR_g7239 [Tetraparma gracilis]|uniref:Cyclic nucleotide-binding domain-containing protein n=1 Tax=Tetraparma gracilis TaxID=2962635 RepID=A0ABQ6MQR6_9STRA|nr:hypothetical protein TeGR_g7239 [Tetraparma gracilis]
MAATAGAATIGYNVWVRRPLVGGKVVIFPITWNGIFMTVNLWQVNKLLRQRRPIDFTHDELDVFETSFSSRMTPRQFHSLLRDAGGRFRRIQAGTKLTAEGKRVGELFFLVDGECSVCIGDDQIEGNIKPRSFVGEMTFLRLLDTHSGVDSVRLPYVGWKVPGFDNMMRRVGGGLTSGATVEVGSGWSGVNVLAWDQESLAKHIAANPNLSNVFEAMLAADLHAT